MPLRRSFLYMPGTDWRKIEKAATELNADSICIDLEDGVALNRKDEARRITSKALQELDFGRSEKLVRINPMHTPLAPDDLAAVLPHRPDGIVLPKVRSAAQVLALDGELSNAEKAHGFPPGRIPLFLIIESAEGVIHLNEIYQASARIAALIFGAEDYSADIGARRSEHGLEVLWARSKVVAYARSIEADAIDIVYPDFHDQAGFTDQARAGLSMGFTGKQLIHPNQIGWIHQVYTPSGAEIEQARRIVEAHAAHQTSGAGAFALDGRMVDMPVVRQAQLILERAGLSDFGA